MNNYESQAREFATFVKSLGFTVYMADGAYGFITDSNETRVLSFSFTDGGGLHGNYGPPSQQSGTGWRMYQSPWDLQSCSAAVSRDLIHRALYATAPAWCGKGWKHYTTVQQHLKLYGQTSKFQRI